MDFPESTKVVFNRIQTLEPDNASKIIGYLLLQDHNERDMIRLAFSPDTVIQSLINRAKTHLNLAKTHQSGPISPSQSSPKPVSDLPSNFTPFSPSPFTQFNPYYAYLDSNADNYHLNTQFQLDSVNSINSVNSDSYYVPEPALGPRTSRRSPSLPDFPVKVCRYFLKGFCKHGNNCRYFHGHATHDSFPQILSPGSGSNSNSNEDCVFLPGSLDKLEMELTELLKSRRGVPVSIASLPMLFHDKYGRHLQAEGYLTESQRNGKAGYNLAKLLSRLNSIRVIDRPHGQHSVILAEDYLKYVDYNGERSEHGPIVVGSRQIYLTFPAESTFTETDVFNHFSMFGPVQDVRIPCQQKRMFGFVTFVSPDTVKLILAKGNPHFVCGARVLVKPYREKSKALDRKYVDKVHQPNYYVPSFRDDSRFLRQHFMEEHEQALELESLRVMELRLANEQLNRHPHFGYSVSMDELEPSKGLGRMENSSAESINFPPDAFDNGFTSEEKVREVKTKCNEQESSPGLNLPDSPFASPIGSGISTVA